MEAKTSPEFFKAVSFCALSQEDYDALGIFGEGNVLVRSEFGEVVVSAKKDEGLPPGVIFIPMGPWANAVVGRKTGGCGTPQFKGEKVEVERTKMPVMDIQELFADVKTRGGDRS